MINSFKLLLIVLMLSSCKNPNEKSELQIYTEKSTELISQIIKSKEIECSCLLEMRHQSLVEIMSESRPSSNNRRELKKALKISSDSIFDKQNELSKQFRIFQLNLNFDMELLNLSQLDSIHQNVGSQNYREVLWEKCPTGKLSISPPVFNETYDIAAIAVGGCPSGGELGIYNLINDEWTYIEHVYIWLSQ